MIIRSKHNGYLAGIRLYPLDIGGSSPDYTPVANASEEAARLGAELGEKQLAEAQRQYDQNMAVAKPVVDAQLAVMQQGIQQGNDYYDYSKTFRPLEQQMAAEAAAGTSAEDTAARDAITAQSLADAQTLKDRTQAYETEAKSDIDLATGGNSAIAAKYASDIDNEVNTAVADARVGQTQAMNSALRQAMRYGLSVPSNAESLASQNAASLAAAANNTRTSAIDKYRGIVANGIGLKQNAFTTGQAATSDAMSKANAALTADRNMKIQDTSLDWAKKLDVTGMARGLPGASAGAYGVAVGAGNSATANQSAAGNSLVSAMGQSNSTQMQGQQVAMNGLTSILNSQSNQDSGLGGLGSLMGGAASLATAFSDRRLKCDIEVVGQDERTGLTLYEFGYHDDPDMRRFVGVMADEVKRVAPWAVMRGADGYDRVEYGMLGIQMKEVV